MCVWVCGGVHDEMEKEIFARVDLCDVSAMYLCETQWG